MDALGRAMVLAGKPRRIVSLVPSHTETLFALGAGQRVAGVTRYCTAPAEAVASLPKVGGTKRVRVDRVLEIGPDLVIANKEENRREDIEALAARGIPVYVTHPRTVAEGIDSIEVLGSLLGSEEAATRIVNPLRARLEELRRREPTRTRRVFVPIWRDPWMTIGRDTYIHDLLALAGGENVFADLPDRYPTVEIDEVARRGPQIVLLPDEPYAFGESDRAELSRGPLAALDPGAIRLVDGQLLSWYGPRIGAAIDLLSAVFSE